ncbi:MAG: LytR C-terminal domain-containing protein [Acidimicrobiales bacterium]
MAAGIPLLVWYGADAILNSTDGELSQPVTDPAAPGYEVLVVPSPSHMVFGLDPSGDLASVTIASLAANDLGGTALFLPAETIMPADSPEYASQRLIDIFETGGEAATRLALATLIDINVDDLTVLDDAGWSRIVEPVAPIQVNLGIDLVSADTAGVLRLAYAAGPVAVTADQTAEFLGWVNDGEATSARVSRQLTYWEEWVARIAASSDPSAVPGEANEGIGRLLRGLGNGPAVVTAVDGVEITLADGSTAVELDVAELRGLVGQMIPFPLPVEPGARPRVRLLDGAGGLDVASLYAQDLVAEGAQIVVIGNAETFGLRQTVVVYHEKRFEAQARAFGEELGGAEVSFQPLTDVVLDVTIIIGSDQGLALGG